MLFSSLDYIVFLGTGRRRLLAAGSARTQFRMVFLFLASCLFYMAWHPAYIVLILTSTVVDYIVGASASTPT